MLLLEAQALAQLLLLPELRALLTEPRGDCEARALRDTWLISAETEGRREAVALWVGEET